MRVESRMLPLVFQCLGAAAPAAAEPFVFLNEVQPRGQERVELYNSQPVAEVIAGWRLVEGAETYVFPGGTTVPAFGYLAVSLNGILNDLGGEIALIDLKLEVQDQVSYGQLGSAPLPPSATLLAGSGISMSRAPDASQGVPPSDRTTDGLFWTLDETATFGDINNAPPPLLGSSALLNEVALNAGTDFVELYNPTNGTIDLGGWFLTNGIAVQMIGGGIGPAGYRVFAMPASFNIDASLLLYLFDRDGARVDQLGFAGAPPEPLLGGSPICYGRSPDGAGPNLGYDWSSSGGGVTLFILSCTLGGRNRPVSGVPDPEGPVERELSWGEVKAAFR